MKKIVLFFVFSLSIAYSFAQKGANEISFGPTYARPFNGIDSFGLRFLDNRVGTNLAYERGLNDYFGLRGVFGFEFGKIDLDKDIKFPIVAQYRYYSFSPELRCYPLGAKKTFYFGLMPKFSSVNVRINNKQFLDGNLYAIGLYFNAGYRKDFSNKLFLQANIGVGNTGDELFSKKESHNYYTGNIMLGYKF